MSAIELDHASLGHDPDHEELLGAARFIAGQIGRVVQVDELPGFESIRGNGLVARVDFDVDEMALIFIHKNAEPSMLAQFKAEGALPLPDGGIFDIIEGERLTESGFPSSAGGMRAILITKLSRRMVEIPLSDDTAEAAGAALLGGR